MTSSPKRKRREKETSSKSPKRRKVSSKRKSKRQSSRKRVSSRKSRSPMWQPGRLRKKQFRVPKNNLRRIKSIFLVKTPSRLERSYVNKKLSREAEEARVRTPVMTQRAATKAAPVTPSRRNLRRPSVTSKTPRNLARDFPLSPKMEVPKRQSPIRSASAETIRINSYNAL